MVRVDVTEIKPSLSVTAGSVLTLILSPSSGGDQVKEGAGTPVAVQVKVTMSPSVCTIIMSATGTVTLTGSERKKQIKMLHGITNILPCTVTVKVTIVFPAALVAVTVNVSLSAGVTVLSCKVDKTEPDMTGNVGLLVMVTTPTPSVKVVLPCIQEMSTTGRLKSEMETDKVRVSPASNIEEATWSSASVTLGITALKSKCICLWIIMCTHSES